MSGIQQMLQTGNSPSPTDGVTYSDQPGWVTAGGGALPTFYAGGNCWIGVSGQYSTSSYFYSTDSGVTWTTATAYKTACTPNMLIPASGPSYTVRGSTFLHAINQSTQQALVAKDAPSWLTSTDNGVTWTWRGSIAGYTGAGNLNSVAKLGTTILLGGQSAQTGAFIDIMASTATDGATWTAPTDISATVRGWVTALGFSSTPRYIISVGVGTSGNYLFSISATGSSTGLYLTSSDLVSATRRTGFESIFSGAKFVTGNACVLAYGYSSTSVFTTATSYDNGVTWTPNTAVNTYITGLGTTVSNPSFVWDGTAFVGIMATASNTAYNVRTVDGVSWIMGTQIQSATANGADVYTPTPLSSDGNGHSMLTFGALAPSPHSARLVTTPASTLGSSWTYMPSNSTLAAVKPTTAGWTTRYSPSASYLLLYATNTSNSDGHVATTTDGITFSTAGDSSFRTTFGTTSIVQDMCAGPTSSAMAVGLNTVPNNIFAHTTNGTTWVNTGLASFQTAMGVNQVLGVAYGAGLWVVVGAAGASATSPDRTTWTARTSLSSQFTGTDTFYRVVYNGTGFVTMGSNGVCATSTDGITWTKRTTLASLVAGGSSAPLPTVAGTLIFATWVLSGGLGASVSAVSSDNGATWSLCVQLNSLSNSGTQGTSNFVAANGIVTVFIWDTAAPTSIRALSSTDGLIWTINRQLESVATVDANNTPFDGALLPSGTRAVFMYYTSGTTSSQYLISP